MGRERILVLGGGPAAMSAVFHLTEAPDWQERFEVVVVQQGHRLGGKGASGRDLAHGGRIVEHGLHVWGGFYHNAFSLMRRAYAELGRPAGSRLATVDQAFVAQPHVVWHELVAGEPRLWRIDFPHDGRFPGAGGPLPSPAELVQQAVGIGLAAARALRPAGAGAVLGWASRAAALSARARRRVRVMGGLVQRGGARLARLGALRELGQAVVQFSEVLAQVRAAGLAAIWGQDTLRRAFVVLDLLVGTARGLIADDVLNVGFAQLDDEDLRAWLGRHGVHPLTLEAAPLRAYYDYFFAYEDGDTTRPRMAAGMGLNHLLRLVFLYKGAVFWKMTAGMGDVVFAPLYEVLAARGVQFRFFHRLEGLVPSADGQRIEAVRVTRQAELVGDYAPLVDVKGLPCWPLAPRLEQLVDGEALRGVDFEDRWAAQPAGELLTWRVGEDFDTVLLAVPPGEFPTVCAGLIAQREDWRTMVAEVKTIGTVALQLWWNADRAGLGWEGPEVATTAFPHPIETWCDMSQTLAQEDWAAGAGPGNVAYYCGPWQSPMPEVGDHAWVVAERERAKGVALGWLAQNLPLTLRGGAGVDAPVRWEALHAPAELVGEARFDHQVLRVNICPSERYVTTLPGAPRFQFRAETSGYRNLALAGDWLNTGLGGSVEGAVMAGMQCARALSGWPAVIEGELPAPVGLPRRSLRPVPA